jgi:outer membrane protein assembly factor BamB
MLAALERHYDFLSGNRPPPVGPLADALAALDERRAAPLLAKQLNDPANQAGDIQKVAQALHKLAGSAELSELKTFFALYRATAGETPLVEAVVLVAESILRVGGDEGYSLVRQAAFDPLTQAKVRQGLNRALRNADSPRSDSKVSVKPGSGARAEAAR